MNIAILIHELRGGGAERVAQIVGNYYVGKGHNVYYFIADTNSQDYPVNGKVVQTGTRSCMSGEYSDVRRFARLLLTSLKIRRLKLMYKIDVSISFMEEFNYLNVLSKGRDKVITRICTILSPREDLKGFLYKKSIIRFFYSASDKVVVMSRYALNDMVRNFKIPRQKLVKIPNPSVDLDVRESKKPWKFGTKAILCVGRLEPIKQQERIIRAFSYVCGTLPDARLVILGKGPQLNYLKGICKKLDIEDSVFFGGFTDDVTYYLNRARAFVMASKVEGFPNSMIEAMSCGVPVITTDSPGACGEIVGKPKRLEQVKSLTFCRYGILTSNMPDEKIKFDSSLAEQEKILGEAMLKVLNEDKIYEKYRKQSFIRAEIYCFDKVIKKWDEIVCGERSGNNQNSSATKNEGRKLK